MSPELLMHSDERRYRQTGAGQVAN
jgi:hypothetical protein